MAWRRRARPARFRAAVTTRAIGVKASADSEGATNKSTEDPGGMGMNEGASSGNAPGGTGVEKSSQGEGAKSKTSTYQSANRAELNRGAASTGAPSSFGRNVRVRLPKRFPHASIGTKPTHPSTHP